MTLDINNKTKDIHMLIPEQGRSTRAGVSLSTFKKLLKTQHFLSLPLPSSTSPYLAFNAISLTSTSLALTVVTFLHFFLM